MKFGVLTDVHLCPPGTPPDGCHNPYAFDRAESLLAEAIAAHQADGVEALLVLGDLANSGDAPSLERAVQLLADAHLPVWITGGNHDRDEGTERLPALARQASSRLQMALPKGEVVAGIRVAGLPITSPGGSSPWFVDQVPIADWGDELVLLLSHFPVLAREEAIRRAGLRYVGSFENRDAVVPGLLRRTAPTVVLHGHLHLRDLAVAGSVLQIGCAALIEPPHERVVLEVADERAVRVRHLPVTASPPVRLPVIAPASSDWRYRGGQWHAAER